MSRYIDKGTARQHLTDRLIESALNNAGFREDADAVFLDIAKNRLPVWLDELETYEVAEVKRGRWIVQDKWLIENNNKYSNYDEVANAFNTVFKTNKTGNILRKRLILPVFVRICLHFFG